MRYDWSIEELEQLFALPFNDLVFRAQQAHRAHFDASEIQLSTLLSIKTGGCTEDCKYCSQSAASDTELTPERLLAADEVVEAARLAKSNGASRFCMGAAWREPKGKSFERVLDIVREVKALGLETCATLGMLDGGQAKQLAEAGLDYYNHNIDTSPDYYEEIVSTHTYRERLDTLQQVRAAGINVCCGGIVGMGESRRQRAGMIAELAHMNPHPESVPINLLVQIPGTALENVDGIDPLEFVRTIAVARITMPASHVRLSAGRESMSDEMQALCFMAGANSIFYGEKLLTTGNAAVERDQALFEKLGLRAEEKSEPSARHIANA